MGDRLKTALLLLAVFLGILFLGPPWLFAAAVAGAAAEGAREYQRMVSPGARPWERALVTGWAAVVVLAFLADPSGGWPGAAVCLGGLAYLAGWMVGPGPSVETLQRWAGALGAWVLVAFFLGHAVWVRLHGVGPVVFVAATIWVGDTAAYYVGSAFGAHRLAPAVSPKKSVEGAVASLVASAAAAGLLGAFLELPHGVGASVALGVGVNVAAQLGDLAESLLKRCAGVKDSGTLFPGHGGVLDRVDAFLFALPLYAAFLHLWRG